MKLKLKTITAYFTKTELLIWCSSILLILTSFLIFDRESYLTLIASLLGATSLIFCAKGNPIGQLIIIIFSLLYGAISYGYAYYGEMITYIGMTLPMAIISLISWLRNPYQGKRSEVKVNVIRGKEYILMAALTVFVTVSFYFILKAFDTANLFTSTLSVTTSFAAVYLTFRRSSYYALAYAINDIVLIALWALASIHEIRYISVVMCFVAFLINDIYSFINWQRIKKRQNKQI